MWGRMCAAHPRWSDIGAEPSSRPGGSGAGADGVDGEGVDGEGVDDEHADAEAEAEAEEQMRRLLQFMQAGGGLSAWQRGADPWGSSTSDAWARKVRGHRCKRG